RHLEVGDSLGARSHLPDELQLLLERGIPRDPCQVPAWSRQGIDKALFNRKSRPPENDGDLIGCKGRRYCSVGAGCVDRIDRLAYQFRGKGCKAIRLPFGEESIDLNILAFDPAKFLQREG